jgi:hypothetical protein
MDEVGTPISGARIVLPESGSSEAVVTDASGTYTWPSLPTSTANLTVTAPGYFPAPQSVTLEPGASEMAMVLRRDPMALAPTDACAPDEKLVYMQDFQDGEAPEWKMTAGDPGGFHIASQDDGNQAAVLSGVGQYQVELAGSSFDNMVWRLKVRQDGNDGEGFLNFHHMRAPAESRYIVQWGEAPLLALWRLDATTNTTLGRSALRIRPGQWHFIESSYLQGNLQVWVDGAKQIEAQDTSPLPAGTIGLEAHIPNDPQTTYMFDNVSVCELSAPFATSLYESPTP